jgi:hypothetical protein
VDESQELQRCARSVDTPWGRLAVLTGDEARAYYRFCADVQAFNHRRRRLFGELLFGPHTEVCNATHQGLRAPGVFHLGSYWFDDPSALFPLTLGPDQPVYLLRPRPSFGHAAIEALGWRERAETEGLLDVIREANMLPHGGGYDFPELARVVRVEEQGAERAFIATRRDGGPEVLIDNIRSLPFAYRGAEVLERLLELELATLVARYRISFVIKDR